MEILPREEEKKYFGIYCIVCEPTGKMYIGQTRQSFYKRWTFHKWELNNNKHRNTHLQNAWNKYGSENFQFYVLKKINQEQKNIQTKSVLSEKEKFYVSLYNTHYSGFNMTDGGETQDPANISQDKRKRVGEINRKRLFGSTLPDNVKKKMSESHKGLVKSKEHRENLSKSLTGFKRSEEQKEKCRIANQGSKQKTAKYTEELVTKIRIDYINGLTVTQLADKYKINRGTMYGIANGLRWKHVCPEGYKEFLERKNNAKHGNPVPSL